MSEKVKQILNQKIKELLQLDGITIVRCGSWLWISGETKKHKEKLKELGLKWAPAKEKWYFAGEPVHSRKSMPWEHIVRKYDVEIIKEEEIA